jgi:hypothetical protein
MTPQPGGCLCGALRYEVGGKPQRVNICHCRFCQASTGSGHAVMAVIARPDFAVTTGTPKVFTLPSAGSGQAIHVNFCETCGTQTHLGFARFSEIIGVRAGTFDDPDWFEVSPRTTRIIFLAEARDGAMIPPGFPTFERHVVAPDGASIPPRIFDEAVQLVREEP